MDIARKDFLEKVDKSRFKTAELKNGRGYIGISSSLTIDWKDEDGTMHTEAMFWGKYKGHHGVWSENELTNFCL